MTTLIAPGRDEAAPRTHLPHRDDDQAPPMPRSGLGKGSPEDRFLAYGAWVAALGLSWVICERLLPLHGVAWFVIVTFLMGLLATALLTAMTRTNVAVADKVAGTLVTGGALAVGFILFTIVAFVFGRGYKSMFHLDFLTHDMSGVGFQDPLSKGGVLHAIIGSLIEILIATAITLPLGVGTAVFMTEVGGKFARIVRTVVEAMTALPSVVAGLFIYTVAIIALGMPRSGLAAGLALSVMMLPIIARAADVVLRVVPGGLREASLALGASRWKTVWNVVLPTAAPGLATALILGIARGIGETSPVLITSGAAQFTVTNPTSGVMNSLPLFIFSTVRSGIPSAVERAFGTAGVLMTLVLLLFVTARWLARPRTTKASRLSRLRASVSGRLSKETAR